MSGYNTHRGAPPEAAPLPEGRCAWFLDIDGTLLEIAETPDLVRCDEDLVELLRRLEETCAGAMALVSGRSIATIDRLVAPLRLTVAGQHGLERRSAEDGTETQVAGPQGLESIRKTLRAWSPPHSGILLEDKGLTLAVHFRRAPHLQDEIRRYLHRIVKDCPGYLLETGKMLFEIKPEGKDKGTAVAEFMAETPFRGRRPVFVGDDVTDEYAFAAVERLGGMTVKVGEGESAARWRLPDVAAVRDWIAAWIQSSEVQPVVGEKAQTPSAGRCS